MMAFLPVLSLKGFVFPTEEMHLHFSAAKDIRLVKDCLAEQKYLGLVYIKEKDGTLRNYGTEVRVIEIAKTLEDGSIHVRLKGRRVFRVLEIKDDIPNKPYSGAIVDYPEQDEQVKVDPYIRNLIISEAQRLYKLIQVEKKVPQKIDRWQSYNFAHRIGLNKEQEYVLLTIFSEIQRMEYIRRHLRAIMPVIIELEEMKKQIEMNGHFRDLS